MSRDFLLAGCPLYSLSRSALLRVRLLTHSPPLTWSLLSPAVALTQNWNQYCKRLGIPVDETFDLVKVLADPLVLRKWHLMGLPADQHSTENG